MAFQVSSVSSFAALDDLTAASFSAVEVSDAFAVIAAELDDAKLSHSISSSDLALLHATIRHCLIMARGIHSGVQLSMEPF
jgi:hypothetical protein